MVEGDVETISHFRQGREQVKVDSYVVNSGMYKLLPGEAGPKGDSGIAARPAAVWKLSQIRRQQTGTDH